jgi:poly(A) polymerase
MRRPDEEFPQAPDLPSFTVEGEPPPEDETPAHPAFSAPGGRPSDLHASTGLIRHAVAIPWESIDEDAARVVRKLERGGFEAYLVGGCVRDLLLAGKPKDYDIATSARPEDVRALFRNCRIIGRRFRLAHVLFGPKIIEVATFRRNPQVGDDEPDPSNSDLLIRNDNAFGNAHEDAHRRDFTINALFYDLQSREVLDWEGGMHDVQRRIIRTIGDPIVRFREDPIRILRAMKFAGRLDLGIAPEVYDAMVLCREELAKAARPRLFEEVLRLLRGGAAHRSFWLAWETGTLAVFLPELAAFLDDDASTHGAGERFWRRLDAVDAMTRETGAPLDDVTLCTALLHETMEEAIAGDRDRVRAVGEFLEPLFERIAIPRKIADFMRRLMAVLPRLTTGKTVRIARPELLPTVANVLEIDLRARGLSLEPAERLRSQIPSDLPQRTGPGNATRRTGTRRAGSRGGAPRRGPSRS